MPPRGPVSGSKTRDQEVADAARASYFDLLRQLQNAVRTVILTATVSNSCVRCSDRLCVQFLQLVRSCLLAGLRRFSGIDPMVHDVLLLLIVPEFAGAFARDLDFLAYLCVNTAAANFVKHLFADAARVAHFYHGFAIVRDEELHLAFVSSLLALEPVRFHADAPALARSCLSASLDEVQCLPPVWPRTRPPLWAASQEERKPASTPDRNVPSSDFARSVAQGRDTNLFGAFLGGTKPAPSTKRQRRRPVPKEEAQEETECPSTPPDPGTDESSDIQRGSWSDWPQQALLRVTANMPLLVLESVEAVEAEGDLLAVETAETGAATEEHVKEIHASATVLDPGDEEAAVHLEETGSAGLFAVELRDAFGLDSSLGGSLSLELRELQASLSLRDLAGLASRAASHRPRPPRCPPLRRRGILRPPPISPSTQAALLESGTSEARLPAQAAKHPQSHSRSLQPQHSQHSPQGGGRGPEVFRLDADSSAGSGSDRGEDEDEVGDAVASLEGLWGAARRESARRLMRSAGGGGLTAAALHETAPAAPGTGVFMSKRSSPASSTAATPRDSTPASASARGGGGGSGSAEGAVGGQDDGLSDSESERSSGHSVSSSLQLRNGAGHGTGAGAAASPCPTPFGVHLEWHLRLRPRLDRGTQVAQQRGCCPGCKERLPPSTLFNAPRYCHYLGCYFCRNCHHGDLRVIPARVAERWDFEPRKVCAVSAKYLDSQVSQPLTPITCIRRTKVSTQAVLTDVHSLRQRLGRMLEVLESAGCGFGETLAAIAASQLEPHLVQGAELYSMQDLISIEQLGKGWVHYGRLSRLVHMGVEHAHVCPDCRSKAHYCPICAAEKPLWAFQVEEFKACPECGAVFHRACFRLADSECPLCLRLRASERQPSISNVRPR